MGTLRIALGAESGALGTTAAEELAAHLRMVFGLEAPVEEGPAGGAPFSLHVASALPSQEFRLQPQAGGVAIEAGSPRALFWAVNELAERWGVRHWLQGSEPARPKPPAPTLDVPVHMRPALNTRTWRLINEFAFGPLSWSLDTNRRYLRQLARLKTNRVMLGLWSHQPFVHYTFRGRPKPPGRLFFGADFPLNEATVGRQFLPEGDFFTNPEFIGAKSPEELNMRAVRLAKGIMAESAALGMALSIAIQPFAWPKELNDLIPLSSTEHQVGNLNTCPSPDMPLDQPEVRDIIATQFLAYRETYPEAEYIMVTMPEARSWTGPAEEAFSRLDAKYGIGDLGSYEDFLDRARQRTDFATGRQPGRVERMVKGDLSGLCVLDELIEERDLLAPMDGHPAPKLVYSHVADELVPIVERIAPEGSELLCFLDYTASRCLKHPEFIERVPQLPASLILTLADDNIGLYPQNATRSIDQLVRTISTHGWDGFSTRYWLIADQDPAVQQLARVSWAEVEPDGGVHSAAPPVEEHYDALARDVCSESTAPAFAKLLKEFDDFTAMFSEKGLGLGFPVPGMMNRAWQRGQLSEPLLKALAFYSRTADVQSDIEPRQEETLAAEILDYYQARFDFAVWYLEASASMGQASQHHKQSEELEAAVAADQAYDALDAAIDTWIRAARDEGDLGAAATLNHHALRDIAGKRVELAGGAEILERVPVGVVDDYKPCVAQLPDGALLLCCFHQHYQDAARKTLIEEIKVFRSEDGGQTWTQTEHDEPPLGRESYFTVLSDGTVLMTVHILPQDLRNPGPGRSVRGYVHRSEDGFQTWTTTVAEPEGLEGPRWGYTSRNVLEMADGSLMLLVSYKGGIDQVWRSRDMGKTWSEKYDAAWERFPEGYPYPRVAESVLWQAESGAVFALTRVDSKTYPPLPGQTQDKDLGDQADRLVLYRTDDEGRTWKPIRDFAAYGFMYPAILKLQDGRLLLTYTVRAIHRPLGVRACFGVEHEDGLEFDFDAPAIILDAKTPNDKTSGGGFGRTVQLADGTLVTSYSYRDAEDHFHCEVVRWRAPANTCTEDVGPAPSPVKT